jgi:hypothetical protein
LFSVLVENQAELSCSLRRAAIGEISLLLRKGVHRV